MFILVFLKCEFKHKVLKLNETFKVWFTEWTVLLRETDGQRFGKRGKKLSKANSD